MTYLIQPMEFPRYVLIAFVGMFAFAGFGAGCVRSTAVRIAIAVLIIHFSVPLIHNWVKVPRDGAWREAVALADPDRGRWPDCGLLIGQPERGAFLLAACAPPRRGRHETPMRLGAGADP